MAHAAYRQAVKLSSFGTDVVGVGCTCALATDREKRGEHKAFITTYNGLQERRWAAAGRGLWSAQVSAIMAEPACPYNTAPMLRPGVGGGRGGRQAGRAVAAQPSGRARVPAALPASPRSFSLLLAKGARSRLGEDTLVSKLLVRAVAESMGLSAQASGGAGSAARFRSRVVAVYRQLAVSLTRHTCVCSSSLS